MNLRTDAWLAASMAGAVMLMAGFSAYLGRSGSDGLTRERKENQYDAELLGVYQDFEKIPGASTRFRDLADLAEARRQALTIYQSRPLRDPMDYFRIGSILSTSSDPRELALSHELSVSALSAGVGQARPVVLASQDRLLLSLGQKQRYGTQQRWKGKVLPVVESMETDMDPAMRQHLGVDGPSVAPKPMAAQ